MPSDFFANERQWFRSLKSVFACNSCLSGVCCEHSPSPVKSPGLVFSHVKLGPPSQPLLLVLLPILYPASSHFMTGHMCSLFAVKSRGIFPLFGIAPRFWLKLHLVADVGYWPNQSSLPAVLDGMMRQREWQLASDLASISVNCQHDIIYRAL
jgi:hypothetical protein